MLSWVKVSQFMAEKEEVRSSIERQSKITICVKIWLLPDGNQRFSTHDVEIDKGAEIEQELVKCK